MPPRPASPCRLTGPSCAAHERPDASTPVTSKRMHSDCRRGPRYRSAEHRSRPSRRHGRVTSVANTSKTTVEHDLREISTPKGALRYYDRGPDSRPVLLFLHGSGPGVTGWRNFRGVLPTFAEHFRCLVLEFPGFGVSDDFGGHPMIDAQTAVVPFLDGLGIEKVDVVGNSMGGAVGINFAINKPDRIGK